MKVSITCHLATQGASIATCAAYDRWLYKLLLCIHSQTDIGKPSVPKLMCTNTEYMQGFWYFSEKKAKFRGIFRGKFAEKPAHFAGFLREKSQNSWKNRPISRDFHGRKVKIRKKIWPISQDFSGKKSNFETEIFRGKFFEKSANFKGNFFGGGGETSPRNNQ